MTQLNDIQIKLAEQLLLSVKRHESVIEYNELAKRITPPIHWRQVGKNIGEISVLCYELGLPLLSAKVINKNTQLAGEGFYDLYEMLGMPTNGKSEQEIYHEQRDAIRKCTEWYKLENYLGLNIGMPRPNNHYASTPQTVGRFQDDIVQDSVLLTTVNENNLSDAPASFEYGGKAKEKAAPVEVGGHRTFPRDRQTSINALAHAGFVCEIDPAHPTFLRKFSGKPYTEPHHLIPVAYSDDFDVSLDVEENIVSLCSNCHNQIHYGQGADEIITRLFNDRKAALEKAGIRITLSQLLSYYKS